MRRKERSQDQPDEALTLRKAQKSFCQQQKLALNTVLFQEEYILTESLVLLGLTSLCGFSENELKCKQNRSSQNPAQIYVQVDNQAIEIVEQ